MIYIDMDGVLADFEGYVESKYNNLDSESFIKVAVYYHKECFLKSNIISKNLNLLKGDFRLLTSLPSISSMLKYCSVDDIDSIIRTLKENRLRFAESLGVSRDNVIILNSSEEKSLYAKDNVLYDDYARNINDWVLAGGTGYLVSK